MMAFRKSQNITLFIGSGAVEVSKPSTHYNNDKYEAGEEQFPDFYLIWNFKKQRK